MHTWIDDIIIKPNTGLQAPEIMSRDICIMDNADNIRANATTLCEGASKRALSQGEASFMGRSGRSITVCDGWYAG